MDELFSVDGYAAGADDYDEMLDGNRLIRPHWQSLMAELGRLGPEDLMRHRQEMMKLLRENGVSYNIYGTPEGQHRPWQLDPVPLPIATDEWAAIEAGMMQRAELLNRILADLYGPRELIRQGLLPLELIYSHNGFLRPSDQMRLPGNHQLVMYAADLARGTDGRIRVIGDRTQVPSGMGYALENRATLSRVLPDLFRSNGVYALESFFQHMSDGLSALAPAGSENPHIVVMTPGPLNETFFEHAYLAAYLGYPLVQGDDLVVRDGHVWLKSLAGLQKVDVILRRVDEDYCDPLELRENSRLGVPGLLEVMRCGNVAIANPLGSGVLENPGLMAFLPGIAEYFGQALALPSIATWWCGQHRECDHVLANLSSMVIKPIHRTAGTRPVFGSRLSRAAQESWRERIKAQPALYVGQEEQHFSTVPSLTNQKLEPRHAVLRSFMVATKDGYAAMPGGLTRCAPGRKDLLVTSQAGGSAKDTWVLAPAHSALPLAAYGPEPASAKADTPLPSRAADNLFWAGRYAERTEGTIRLMRIIIKGLFDQAGRSNRAYAPGMACLLQTLTVMTGTYPGFLADNPPDPEPELRALAFDETRPGSLAHSLRSQLQASYAVRDLWSSDTWRIMDELEEQWIVAKRVNSPDLWQAMDLMDQLLISLSAFGGMAMESMTRGKGWLFLNIGRRLERAVQLFSLLRSAFSLQRPAEIESYLINALLDSSDNLIRNQFQHESPGLEAFIEMLMFDDDNPRSLIYQFERLHEYIAELPAGCGDEHFHLTKQTMEALRRAHANGLLAATPTGTRLQLDTLLGNLSGMTYRISDALTAAYFRHEQSHPLTQAQAV